MLLCIWEFHLLSGVFPNQQGTTYMNVEWTDDSLLGDLHAHVQLLQHVRGNTFLLIPGQARKLGVSHQNHHKRIQSQRGETKATVNIESMENILLHKTQQNQSESTTLKSNDRLCVHCVTFFFPISTQRLTQLSEVLHMQPFSSKHEHMSVPCQLGSCSPTSGGTYFRDNYFWSKSLNDNI